MKSDWFVFFIVPLSSIFLLVFLDPFWVCLVFVLQSALLTVCIKKHILETSSIVNTALDIAAGNYGNKIDLSKASHLGEIANTLNTLSDCLRYRFEQDKIATTHLKNTYHLENTLQQFMAIIPIKNYNNDTLLIDALHIFCHNSKGIVVDILKDGSHFYMAESLSPGIDGMYDLFTNYKHSNEFPYCDISFKDGKLSVDPNSFSCPIVWSLSKKSIVPFDQPLEEGDFFFLHNTPFQNLYGSHKKLELLFNKVLRIFFQEGLSIIKLMLEKEIKQAFREKGVSKNIYLLMAQVL